MSASDDRPTAVDTAFWLLIAGSILLLLGGVMAATMSFDNLRHSVPSTVSDDDVRGYLRLWRGVGGLFGLAAVALAGFAGRARSGDPRARRAVMALGLTIVVLVGVLAVFVFTTPLALLSLVPILAGTLLINRPAVVEWYAGD